MKRYFANVVPAVGGIVLALVVAIGIFVSSGAYNIGADSPHWSTTAFLINALRERSIDVRAESISVPRLDDPKLVLKGAGQYSAMCVNCHLAPGMENSELRKGLYPQPPNLSRAHVAPGEAFWAIKHGIKMSAMPAWGGTHDDATIWSMVAFMEKLPTMTPAKYKAIVAKAPPDLD